MSVERGIRDGDFSYHIIFIFIISGVGQSLLGTAATSGL
jgi:hypothetical protein